MSLDPGGGVLAVYLCLLSKKIRLKIEAVIKKQAPYSSQHFIFIVVYEWAQ
jgi:hypothetical protein